MTADRAPRPSRPIRQRVRHWHGAPARQHRQYRARPGLSRL